MKKFFEFLVTSRKEAKGELILTAEVFTEGESKVGQLQVKKLNNETNSSIFFRYVPEEGPLTDEISVIQFSGNKDKISEVLNKIKASILDIKKEKASLDELILKMAISNCIDAEECKITIPNELFSLLDIPHPTNELIVKYTSDEWIGLEAKFSPDIHEKIKSAADEKRKKEELEAQKVKESFEELSALLGRL